MHTSSMACLIVIAGITACTSSSLRHSQEAAISGAAVGNTTVHADQVLFFGNEGMMISHGSTKVLFDPFFHNSPQYTVLAPEPTRRAIFNEESPFDGVAAVFVTHMHGDHYNGPDLLRYLTLNTRVRLYTTRQVLERLQREEAARPELIERVISLSASEGNASVTANLGSISIEALPIPHIDIGRPTERMEHLVFRVTIGDGATVLHFGDADPNPRHYLPYASFWQARRADMAFAPFWFFGAEQEGPTVDVKRDLNTSTVVGVHVWPNMIEKIRNEGRQDNYFLLPGESREIPLQHDQ
jgi:L-ascorbate metabolism protein UlaG (beta-lactamase superfamily)